MMKLSAAIDFFLFIKSSSGKSNKQILGRGMVMKIDVLDLFTLFFCHATASELLIMIDCG